LPDAFANPSPPPLAISRGLFIAALNCAALGAIVMWRLGEAPSRVLLFSGLIAITSLYATFVISALKVDTTPHHLEVLSELAVFSLFLAFYAATAGSNPSPFDAHVRQAFAFVHGHVWIDAPNFIEHAQVGKFSYQLHPLLPAFLLIPFAAVWGMDTNQTIFCMMFGALDVALAWRMLARFRLTSSARIWLTAFFGLGTIVWYEAINGGSWEVSMLVAIAFTLVALDEVLGDARPAIVGLFAGLAALARYDLSFTWPFFVSLTYLRRPRLSDLKWMAPGFALTAIIYVVFNEIRYHSLFDRGVFIFAPAGSKLFGFQYLVGNLNTVLFMQPSENATFPYFHPTFGGQALIFTSPAFILAMRPSFRRIETVLIGLAAIVTMIPSLLYWTNGFSQFGTRHYLHAFPFLLVLMALGIHRRADQLTKILIAISIFLITFGVWHIRWYGFG
jgi:hypothetical protein